ncbi:MAG: molecular chaperone TorD family protein [Kiritimatiellia bacterium]|jgi:TorA maturation chaperone TorD|nr:molecular chaperone TorD family protein [Kiritimatiellia bacterium]MDP6630429.1 molecular chaperone TorD family protein [Kiritimatiellia bacterium]MDP6809886.1 molecular chaperone TorD family protein [Kiritimatiellia bacterium]MDP7024278.1 molecular chaperone TorD family protein [Kiritimatiellia bacterium]
MSSTPDHTPNTDPALQQARSCLYQFFALALSDPLSERADRLRQSEFVEMAAAAADFMSRAQADDAAVLAPGEMPASEMSLQPVLKLFERSAEHFEADYQNTFGLLMSKECPPYETEYCPQTFSVFRSNELADIAGYYHAFGVEPSRDRPERQDHIALELEFMAWLIGKALHADRSDSANAAEGAALCRDAQRDFFEKHLVWWIPAFCAALELKVKRASGEAADGSPAGTFYGCVARALSAFVGWERNSMKIEPPTALVEPNPDTDDAEMECAACSGAPA